MDYLQYQLHVLASALAIIRLAFNLSIDYTICMVYPPTEYTIQIV